MLRFSLPLIALLLASAAAASAQEADFFPLQTGQTWTYQMSTGETRTVQVTSHTTFHGVDCAVVETSAPGGAGCEYLAATAKGLFLYRQGTGATALEFGEPIQRVKFPFTAGETWTVKFPVVTGDRQDKYTSETIETVRVPAGTYSCIKVTASWTTTQGPETRAWWYAKGLGLVRELATIPGSGTVAMELAAAGVRAAPPEKPMPHAKNACPHCGKPMKEGAQFCPHCGAALEGAHCPACGAVAVEGARFCGQCGAPLRPEPRDK